MVTSRGPYPTGDGREDEWEDAHEGLGPDEPDDDAEDPTPSGWLPPEDRLWRHPSEISSPTASNGDPADATGHVGPGSAEGWSGTIHAVSGRRRATAMALVGSGAAAVVFAGIVLLNTVGSGQGGGGPAAGVPNTSVVLTTSPTSAIPAAARGAEQGLVSLNVTTSSGVHAGGAVAVAKGGLVATTADAVLGATGIVATPVGGQGSRAEVVAVDRKADVALLRVDHDIPVPRFADDATVGAGLATMVVAVNPPAGGSTPSIAWGPATVESVGTTVLPGGSHPMAAIGVAVTHLAPRPGEVLLQPDGGIIGMLQGKAAGTGTEPAISGFVPAGLLLGVTGDLARWGRVHHGWLDITAHDPTTADGAAGPAGALVVQVDPHGAAAGVLRVGDMIDSVDGAPVRTVAELSQRLYVCTAGESVQVGVRRNGAALVVEVDLGPSP